MEGTLYLAVIWLLAWGMLGVPYGFAIGVMTQGALEGSAPKARCRPWKGRDGVTGG